MKKVIILLLAVLLLAGAAVSAWAEAVEEPAVILPNETLEAESQAEESSTTNQTGKTENNYNHKVLLEDENCKITLADAILSSEEGWSLTVSCENKGEEPLVFSWENTAVREGEEETIWEELIPVAPEARTQLTFCTSELKEAELLQLKVVASAIPEEETEEEPEDVPDSPAPPEESKAETTEQEQEEPAEPYHAEATAVMKNANGITCVLDNAFSPIVVDFEALTERNGDVCGWLYCPDTVISYPVVQAEDNSFYLHRDIDLNYSSYGTLFTETMSEKNFDNDNSIIYGHHMKDGGMFAGLVNYAKKSYYEKHPVFYLNTPEMNYRVEVFAAFLTDMYSDAYNNAFDSDEEMQTWLDIAKALSAIETDVEVSPGDRVLTLSTCTYEYDTARYVVMGKMVPIQ